MQSLESAIRKRIVRAIEERVFPGCVVGVVQSSGERLVLPFGGFMYEQSAPSVTEDSLFDVASITKAIPTAALAAQFIVEGTLRLDDRVADLIPSLHGPYQERILVRHLLTQTLDFGFRLSSLREETPEKILERIFEADLRRPPGEAYAYHNATSILLGFVVERVSSQRLDRAAQEHFFEPLGMRRTTFTPDAFPKAQIIPTEHDPWRGRLIHGEVHDESAWKLRQKRIVGSAGLFSTAGDLLTFLEMLLNAGTLNGKRCLEKEAIELMSTNQLFESAVQALKSLQDIRLRETQSR